MLAPGNSRTERDQERLQADSSGHVSTGAPQLRHGNVRHCMLLRCLTRASASELAMGARGVRLLGA
jgi:hypothetical protein